MESSTKSTLSARAAIRQTNIKSHKQFQTILFILDQEIFKTQLLVKKQFLHFNNYKMSILRVSGSCLNNYFN